jgi:hypothetical protein
MSDLVEAADGVRDTLAYSDGQLKQIIDALQEAEGAEDVAKERFRSLADKLEDAADRLRLAATDDEMKH